MYRVISKSAEASMLLQQNDSTIVLDSVPYGASGAWAVNLWFKPGPLYGDNFQYLFSHAQDKFYATGWESNQAWHSCPMHALCSLLHSWCQAVLRNVIGGVVPATLSLGWHCW